MEKQIHYVYEWIRSDLNLPYYIGKGVGKRAYELKRNDDTNDVTQFLLENNIGKEIRIIAHFVTEEAAFEYEKERIAFWWYLKDHDILTNKTKGGDGAASGDLNPQKRPEARARVSVQMSGENNPMKKPEVVKKNKEATKGFRHTEESILKISNSKKGQRKGIPLTEEHKQNMRKPRTEEGKQRNLEAQRRRSKKAKELGIPNHMKGKKNLGSSKSTTLRWEKYREDRINKVSILSDKNSSGLIGVKRVKKKGELINRWDASVNMQGKLIELGRFDCPVAASCARQIAILNMRDI
jgi:hypothetical protein